VASAGRSFFTWLGNFSGALASVFFPAGGRLGHELLPDVRRIPICNHCRSSLQVVPRGACDLCGQPGTFDPEFPKAVSFCPDCQGHRFAFQLARSFGLLGIAPLGTWFADRLAELARLHRLRARERGFNHVDVFGRPFARRLSRPCVAGFC
jgi:predicted amidophosphoribosyltransferase